MTVTFYCPICDKGIGDEEYVVNWGTCGDCLDANFAQYLKEHPEPPDSEISLDFEA